MSQATENQPRERIKVMKPPRGDAINTAAATSQLEELSAALEAGKLAELLRGKGLTRSTVDELLRPESAAKLQAILTHHFLPARDACDPSPGHQLGACGCEGGKVLVFNARETIRS